MRYLVVVLLLSLFACQNKPQNIEAKVGPDESTDSIIHNSFLKKDTLKPTEQEALDLLDELQTSSDERSKLYSTFPLISQPCYPPDTVVQISQADFGEALRLFIRKHYQDLGEWDLEDRAIKIASVQKFYRLAVCFESPEESLPSAELPQSGTWVIQAYLNERDVVLHW